MRLAELTTVAALMLLGGLVLFDAVRLGIGWGTDGPQSGFFPFWLALIMVVICVAIAVRAERRVGATQFVSRRQLGPVLKVLGPAVFLVLLTQLIGLYVASGLYLGFYMRWVGRHRWATVVVLAIAIPAVTFVVFERWFLVPMPKGPLEQWLGY